MTQTAAMRGLPVCLFTQRTREHEEKTDAAAPYSHNVLHAASPLCGFMFSPPQSRTDKRSESMALFTNRR